jgi:hypothetical protein
MLTAGLVGLGLKQPYGVYYPLLLGGSICSIVGGVSYSIVRKRYAEVELRRMQALDAGR